MAGNELLMEFLSASDYRKKSKIAWTTGDVMISLTGGYIGLDLERIAQNSIETYL